VNSAEKVFGVKKLLVESNTVELVTKTTSEVSVGDVIGFHVNDGATTNLDPTYPAYVFNEVNVRDNKIRYVDGAFASNYAGYGIQINGAKNLLVRNNVVESAQTNPIRNTRCGSVKYFNDQAPSGVLIKGYNEDNGKKYDELETEAEDALVLALFNGR